MRPCRPEPAGRQLRQQPPRPLHGGAVGLRHGAGHRLRAAASGSVPEAFPDIAPGRGLLHQPVRRPGSCGAHQVGLLKPLGRWLPVINCHMLVLGLGWCTRMGVYNQNTASRCACLSLRAGAGVVLFSCCQMLAAGSCMPGCAAVASWRLHRGVLLTAGEGACKSHPRHHRPQGTVRAPHRRHCGMLFFWFPATWALSSDTS